MNVAETNEAGLHLGRLTARRDLLVVAIVTLSVLTLAVHFELSESVLAVTRRFEHLQLDELVLTLLALSLSLTWFAWRRFHDAQAELARRRAAEEQLAKLLLDHRQLAQKHLHVQEMERKFLARELHDELGQYLNAIKVDAVSIQAKVPDGESPIWRGAAVIIQHADHVYAVVRDLIRRLRPIGLDELGLEAALEQYVDDWRRRLPQVQLRLSLEGDLDALGEPHALTVYRLLQEGMTNVSKHAGAKHVEIRVERSRSAAGRADEVLFSMMDDGRGADLSAGKPGLGLIGMRERIETLGGSLQVTAEPTKGFGIQAHIPAVDTQEGATE